MEKWKNRVAEYPVDAEFISRVSTRAFDAHKPVSKETLMSCFEAARWAPSSYNNQPWRYVWAEKGSRTYKLMTDTMVEFNRMWCKDVSILLVICTRKAFMDKDTPTTTGSLDTGSSYMSFVLQAHKLGLATHAMAGFDNDKLREAMNIPDIYNIEALLAVGYPGKTDHLPKEMLEREKPTDRRSLDQIVNENTFIYN